MEPTSSTTTITTSIPLPRRAATRGVGRIWELEDASDSSTARDRQLDAILGISGPLAEKCAAASQPETQCCKNLKGKDDRHLVSPEVVRDIIIGLSDGLTVPFALTAGLSSIGSSRLVVTGGLAELFAGAISMGLGGYLASRAELDHYHYLKAQLVARIHRSCDGEIAREVHGILGPFGVREQVSRLVIGDLRPFESSVSDGSVTKGDKGLTALILKLGLGMEEVPRARLWISALTIGLSYFCGGLIPLIPYMANISTTRGLIISSSLTAAVLFVFGGVKTYFTGARGGLGGYLYGAISTMIVGAIAAGAAYGLVRALHVQE